MDKEDKPTLFIGDILQIRPDHVDKNVAGHLFIVTKVQDEFVTGYVQMDGYDVLFSLPWGEFERTGGIAHWITGDNHG